MTHGVVAFDASGERPRWVLRGGSWCPGACPSGRVCCGYHGTFAAGAAAGRGGWFGMVFELMPRGPAVGHVFGVVRLGNRGSV